MELKSTNICHLLLGGVPYRLSHFYDAKILIGYLAGVCFEFAGYLVRIVTEGLADVAGDREIWAPLPRLLPQQPELR